MFYPTGDSPNGKLLICMDDSKHEIDEALCNCDEGCMTECLTEWLQENDCCVESWQMKKYLKEKGLDESRIDEDMAAGAGPAVGAATLGTVSGMGNPATPQNGGTNAGFNNSALDGSGDKFSSMTVGTGAAKKKKGRVVETYLDFLKRRKKD